MFCLATNIANDKKKVYSLSFQKKKKRKREEVVLFCFLWGLLLLSGGGGDGIHLIRAESHGLVEIDEERVRVGINFVLGL